MPTSIAILQSGRLGDLWYAMPLARHLSREGHEVEVVYDERLGAPFDFFPYVTPRPVAFRHHLPNRRWGHFYNEIVWQIAWLARLRREGRRVHWNQVFPFRFPQAFLFGRPYVEQWYRRHPGLEFRRAESTLEVANDGTILVFQESQSIAFDKGDAYYDWIYANLDRVAARTGYRPINVLYGEQPDRAGIPSWRGSLNDYQRLIARSGLVFGISTSAHVLGQLLGKPVVALYSRRQSVVNTIGAETAAIRQGTDLSEADLDRITSACRV